MHHGKPLHPSLPHLAQHHAVLDPPDLAGDLGLDLLPPEVRVPLAGRQDHGGLRGRGIVRGAVDGGGAHAGAQRVGQRRVGLDHAAICQIRTDQPSADFPGQLWVAAGGRESLGGAQQSGRVGLGKQSLE